MFTLQPHPENYSPEKVATDDREVALEQGRQSEGLD
jgi:hypothetical protein